MDRWVKENMTPIKAWKNALKTGDLKSLYNTFTPAYAELILNSYCPFTCQHCIYSHKYHLYNKNLPLQTWKQITEKLHRLGFRTFILSGRQLLKHHLQLTTHIKQLPATKVGLIADGPAIAELKEDLLSTNLDWLDISIDGMREDHDEQRCSKGAFEETIQFLEQMVGKIKLSILTCLTSINHNSLPDMIKYLHNKGIINFVITPISIVGNKPNPSLRPSKEQFTNCIERIKRLELPNAWIDIKIYSHEYIQYLSIKLKENYDVLQYKRKDFTITYAPMSINGLTEFIINTDGSIIPPTIMAYGKIKHFGNILDMPNDLSEIYELISESKTFKIYERYLEKESIALKDIITFI